jgi:hypothetical protein
MNMFMIGLLLFGTGLIALPLCFTDMHPSIAFLFGGCSGLGLVVIYIALAK